MIFFQDLRHARRYICVRHYSVPTVLMLKIHRSVTCCVLHVGYLRGENFRLNVDTQTPYR